jgi:hypothetical protein
MLVIDFAQKYKEFAKLKGSIFPAVRKISDKFIRPNGRNVPGAGKYQKNKKTF